MRISANQAVVGAAQSSDIYDLIKNATPLTPVSAYKNTENRRRHYEKVPLLRGASSSVSGMHACCTCRGRVQTAEPSGES